MSCEHYKKLYPISNNIEVYGDQVWRTKKIPHCAVKFEAGKENRIGTVFLFWSKCWNKNSMKFYFTEILAVVKQILALGFSRNPF